MFKLFMKRRINILWILGLSPGFAFAADTFTKNYEQQMAAEVMMPENCSSPYKEAGNFAEFYQSAINIIAAQKGAASAGVTDLFAVAELRNRVSAMVRASGEESPVDRLLIAQLCKFYEIKKAENIGPKVLMISAKDADLQKHLVAIAPKLYQDSRKITVDLLAAQARAKKQEIDLTRQWSEVEEARIRGQSKVEDLFEP